MIRPRFALHVLLLTALSSGCSDDGDDEAPDAGEAAEDAGLDVTATVQAVFVVPREGDDGAPWDLPFPSDLLRGAGGVGLDLSRFPNPVHSESIDMFTDLLAAEVDGFSTAGTAYLRFSGPIDVEHLPTPQESLAEGSPIFLVALETGVRVPVVLRWQETESDYWEPDMLAVRAVNGFVLAPATTYALVATRGLVAATDGTEVGASPDLRAVLGLEEGDAATDDARARVYGPAADRLVALGTPLDEIVSLAVFTTMDPVGEMFQAAEALRREVPEPDVTEIFVDQPGDDYTLLTGHYGPAPLYQTGESPFDAPGSGRIEFVGGEPVLQEETELRFAVVIPGAPMPPEGYPVVITSHGTGGDYKSFVEDGTASRLAAYGVASIGFDQVLHGERAPPGTQPENTFFNFLNPVAGRDNARQSVLDNVQQARLVARMVIPTAQLPNDDDAFFDPTRIGFFGHSQGGLNGSLLLAIDDSVHAAVLSGTGAVIGWAILQKTEPTAILPLIEVLLDMDSELEGFDIFHPVLMLLQTFIDPADPVNYASFWSTSPRLGDGCSVLLTEGLADAFAPPLGTEAIAVAGHLPILGLVSQPIPGLELLGIGATALPAAGNVTSSTGVPLTSGIWQVPGHGHFAVFDEPGLTAASAAFLASATSTPPGTIALP